MPLILLLLVVAFVAHFAWLLAAFGASHTPPRWWLGRNVPGLRAAYRLLH